ncbi:bifunctional lytic transglycosylase/C40 family peptidase [Nocardia abscessus]|uniref:C40 family peptidase n=1 Tax=Nocardia abscessus TaxID=120957 RepID=UPI0018939797|nr:NlpC/P60 family protein [Nocardia abscessus]MBF6341789.1 bifunctional lytic transglycosylase/C40 family peptidase [Nocardia abscessus]
MLVKALGAGFAGLAFLTVVIATVVSAVVVFDQALTASSPGASTGTGSSPSTEAQQDIPAEMLVLYQAAAGNCPGLDWSVLAAIGKIETNHGRSTLPGVSSGENASGAGGPMQFLVPTFDSVVARHPLPASGASPPSRYNPSDAIHAAAFYLCDSGAPGDLRAAIFAYNHADWYVNQVLDQAAHYRATDTSGGGCQTASPTTPTAAQVISFACAQLGLPYVWGGNGPDVNGGWDCSGLTQAAYRSAGISIPRTTYDQVHTGTPVSEGQLAPGDLVFYGTAADVHHVGIYLGGGQMVHAPTFDKPVQISSYRWKDDDFYAARRPAPAHNDSPATP